MKIQSLLLLILCFTGLEGCVSHQTHERTIEELELANQNSVKEIERLQAIAQEAESKQAIQEEKLEHLQKERQELATGIQTLHQSLAETTDTSTTPLLTAKRQLPVSSNIDHLAGMLQELRKDLEGQTDHFNHVQQERDTLLQNVDTLETRLAEIVEQSTAQETLLNQQEQERAQLALELQELKIQTGEIREAKEKEAMQLAQIKQERESIEGEIGQVANTFKQQVGEDLRIQQEKDRLVLTVLGKVLFESGKAQLTPLGLEVMSQIGDVLSKLPNKDIHVEGHTDTRPIFGQLQKKYQTNWELSTARATTVVRFLIDKTGMDPKHFVAAGYADTHPVAANETEEGRSRNRRVELVLYPKTFYSTHTNP